MALHDEDELLTRIISETTAEASGTRGGGAASRFVSRRQKKNEHETQLRAALTPQAALARAEQVLSTEGRPLATGERDGHPAVQAHIPTGMGGLTPALVTVVVVPESGPDEPGVLIRVRGVSKEGLIKVRAGQKAAERVATAWQNTAAA